MILTPCVPRLPLEIIPFTLIFMEADGMITASNGGGGGGARALFGPAPEMVASFIGVGVHKFLQITSDKIFRNQK